MNTKITVQANINAPLKKVWNYYTNPEHIIHWNFASDDWCCPHAENDLRVGGIYNARMEAKDGSFGFDFEAIYTAIEFQKSFIYEMDGREVIVTFDKNDLGKTIVNISFDSENDNSLELQKNGWQAILNNFKNYVERS